jgi:hypothetical protein
MLVGLNMQVLSFLNLFARIFYPLPVFISSLCPVISRGFCTSWQNFYQNVPHSCLITTLEPFSVCTCLWLDVKHKSKSHQDRRSVGQSVLVSSTHLRPKTRCVSLSDSCGFVVVGRSLWREDECVVYNCCWSSPAQSFSGPSSAGLIIIFYCLRFETLPTWRVRSPYLYPPGTGWPCYIPRHWVPFASAPATHRTIVRNSNPPPRGGVEHIIRLNSI